MILLIELTLVYFLSLLLNLDAEGRCLNLFLCLKVAPIINEIPSIAHTVEELPKHLS
jgi:hypothetical protein